MTTDRGLARALICALPLVAIGWIATLALVLRMGGAAAGVLVPFPPADLLARLPAGVAITGSSPVSVTLSGPTPGPTPGLVAQVYAAGAWLVLPAGLEACIPAALRATPGQSPSPSPSPSSGGSPAPQTLRNPSTLPRDVTGS